MGCDIGYLGDPKNNITCKECPTYDKINDNGTGDTICSGNGTCQLDGNDNTECSCNVNYYGNICNKYWGIF